MILGYIGPCFRLLKKWGILAIVSKQLNLIGTMKTFTKPNFNLCMEKRLTTPKNVRDKRVMVMNNNSEIHGAFQHKTTFHQLFLSTDCPILNG